MTDTITTQFTLTKEEIVEGISVASNTLLSPWQRRVSSLVQLVVALLAGAGSVGLFMLAYREMFGSLPHFYFVLIVFLVVAGFGLVHYGMVLDWMSTRAVALEDPTGTHMEIDASGLHIWASQENRRLQWPAVYGLTHGKTAIFLSISGAAFILPNRALDNPKAAFAQMQTWHKAAA